MDDGQVKTRRSRANRTCLHPKGKLPSNTENYRMVKNFNRLVFFDHHFFEKLVGQKFSPPGNFFDRRFESGWVIGWASGWVNGWVIFPFSFFEFNSKSLFFELGSRVVIIQGRLDLDFVFESPYCLIIYIWAHGFGFDSRLR